jgi:hypothetical protein
VSRYKSVKRKGEVSDMQKERERERERMRERERERNIKRGR